jgi:hypothetical protein
MTLFSLLPVEVHANLAATLVACRLWRELFEMPYVCDVKRGPVPAAYNTYFPSDWLGVLRQARDTFWFESLFSHGCCNVSREIMDTFRPWFAEHNNKTAWVAVSGRKGASESHGTFFLFGSTWVGMEKIAGKGYEKIPFKNSFDLNNVLLNDNFPFLFA